MESTGPVPPSRRHDLRSQRSLTMLGYGSIPEALRQPDTVAPPATEAVMMLSNHGELFQLNLVAGFVWDLIDGSNTTDELVAEVTEVFDVDDARAQGDVRALLRRMDDLGLLVG
jgi:hypothetical protein